MKQGIILTPVVLLLIISGSLFGQADYLEPDLEPLLPGELFTPVSQPNPITYFNNNWISGDITFIDGRKVSNKKMKYNGLLDELFWFEPISNQTIKLDKEAIHRFSFYSYQGDSSVLFRKIKIKRETFTDSTEVFVQELIKGELSLLVLHSFYFKGTEIVPSNRKYILKDIYIKDPTYYIVDSEKNSKGFKRINRKSLLAFLPERKEQIRKFFRDGNSGRLTKNQDIKNLILFLNSAD